MGTYGTATGVVIWYNTTSGYGELLNLVDGEAVFVLSGGDMTLDGTLTLGLGGKLVWDNGRSSLDSDGMHLEGYLYHNEPNHVTELHLVSKYAHRTSTGGGNYAALYYERIYGQTDGINYYPVKYIELYHNNSLYNRYTWSIDGLDMNSERITSLADPVLATDALNQQSGDLRYGRRWRTWMEAA